MRGTPLGIAPDPPLPAPPTGFITQVSGSTVNLSWEPGVGGGPVLSYQLEAGSAPGLADLLVTDVGGQALVVPGVPPGRYFVRVRGLNSSGLGAPSTDAAVRVGCGGPPLLPSGLTGSVGPGGMVSLQWQGTSEATGYLIEAGSGPDLANLAQIPVGGTGVSGAVPAGTYYARVRALTSCGITPASNEVVLVVP